MNFNLQDKSKSNRIEAAAHSMNMHRLKCCQLLQKYSKGNRCLITIFIVYKLGFNNFYWSIANYWFASLLKIWIQTMPFDKGIKKLDSYLAAFIMKKWLKDATRSTHMWSGLPTYRWSTIFRCQAAAILTNLAADRCQKVLQQLNILVAKAIYWYYIRRSWILYRKTNFFS